MKQLTAVLALTMIVAFTAFATSPKTTNYSKVDWQKAEKNYLAALASSNVGLRQSAANYLAEYRLTGAVQPLIVVLQTDKVEQLRMAAALALVQLGNKEGIEAVKDASIYDGSEKVAKFCEQLISVSSQELSMK
ncbi:MAG: HEAT repeat domain-containing protein [Bacteroidota bacterium]